MGTQLGKDLEENNEPFKKNKRPWKIYKPEIS